MTVYEALAFWAFYVYEALAFQDFVSMKPLTLDFMSMKGIFSQLCLSRLCFQSYCVYEAYSF